MFSDVKMLEQSRILASNSYNPRCNLWVASRVVVGEKTRQEMQGQSDMMAHREKEIKIYCIGMPYVPCNLFRIRTITLMLNRSSAILINRQVLFWTEEILQLLP